MPPKPGRPVPKASKAASPKPSPPPSPPSTPKAPKASSTTASAPSGGKAGAAVRAPGGRIDLTPLIRAQQERGSIGRNLVVFFDWHDTLDCARNALKLFDQSTLNKFIDLVQIARGRIESYCLVFRRCPWTPDRGRREQSCWGLPPTWAPLQNSHCCRRPRWARWQDSGADFTRCPYSRGRPWGRLSRSFSS